jgi:hypothetical protein
MAVSVLGGKLGKEGHQAGEQREPIDETRGKRQVPQGGRPPQPQPGPVPGDQQAQQQRQAPCRQHQAHQQAQGLARQARNETANHPHHPHASAQGDEEPGTAKIAEGGLAQGDGLEGEQDEKKPMGAVRGIGQGPPLDRRQEQAEEGHEEPKDQQDDDFEGQVHTPGPGGWGLDCRLAHGGDSLVIKRVRPAARTGHARRGDRAFARGRGCSCRPGCCSASSNWMGFRWRNWSDRQAWTMQFAFRRDRRMARGRRGKRRPRPLGCH